MKQKLKKILSSSARGSIIVAIPEACSIPDAVEHKRSALKQLSENQTSPAVVTNEDNLDISFVFGFKENLLRSENYQQQFIKECEKLNLEFNLICLV